MKAGGMTLSEIDLERPESSTEPAEKVVGACDFTYPRVTRVRFPPEHRQRIRMVLTS
jgi:hypothetical protein